MLYIQTRLISVVSGSIKLVQNTKAVILGRTKLSNDPCQKMSNL